MRFATTVTPTTEPGLKSIPVTEGLTMTSLSHAARVETAIRSRIAENHLEAESMLSSFLMTLSAGELTRLVYCLSKRKATSQQKVRDYRVAPESEVIMGGTGVRVRTRIRSQGKGLDCPE